MTNQFSAQICGTFFAAVLFFNEPMAAQSPTPTPTLTTIHSFAGSPTDGANPWAGVVMGSGPAGHPALYGATAVGGLSENGTLFLLAPPASPNGPWTETVLYNFAGSPDDGAQPLGGVVIGNEGVLYGTTDEGGNDYACTGSVPGCGTVFSLTPPTSPGGPWIENVIYNFAGSNIAPSSDGASPNAGLAIDSDGVLYGTTFFGGTSNLGTVFSLTPPLAPGGVWTETVLHSFTAYPDGAYPWAGVLIGTGGVLYGTTEQDGDLGGGTVFSLTPPAAPGDSWTETTLYAFGAVANVGGPWAGVAIGSGGVLYGEAGNAVFSLAPPSLPGGSWVETLLYDFPGSLLNPLAFAGGVTIGAGPRGGTVLYGTSTLGGGGVGCYDDCGTVFALASPAAAGDPWSMRVLHAFNGNDGATPLAGVLIVGDVLYGTTAAGGLSGDGTAFVLKP